MKKLALFFVLSGIILSSGVVRAEDDAAQRDKMQALRETIAEEANYIRQLDNDNTLSAEQRKTMIDLHIQKMNEKYRQSQKKT